MDIDYDEMIEDYIQGGNDEPDHYDYEESLMYEEAMTNGAETTTAPLPPADNSATTHSNVQRNVRTPPTPEMVDDNMPIHRDDDDDDDDDSASVRELFAQKRDAPVDPFSFERYNSRTAWRNDAPKSPRDCMRATEWKDTNHMVLGSRYMEPGAEISADTCRTQAPDVQLMAFTRPPRRCIPIRALRYKYGGPVAGSKCLQMTLGDGMRVFFPVVEEAAVRRLGGESEPQTSGSVLGISMDVLIRRVNATRRRQEHEKQRSLSRLGGNSMLEDVEETGVRPPGSSDSKLWVDKHAPSTFAHLLSDERTNREVLRALRAWDPYVFDKEPPPRPQIAYTKPDAQPAEVTTKTPRNQQDKDRRPDESSRVILLSGPSGVGKTTLAHIISRHAGYRPIEVNGSDERSASVLTERLVRAMESSTLNFTKDDSVDGKCRPNCIIMDEIDGADAKGAVKALVDIIRAGIPVKGAKRTTFLRRPIIFICNNKWAPALRPLLSYAKQFDVGSPSSVRLVSRLQAVLKLERLTVSGGSSMLNSLVALASGDIRSCLYTLQFVAYRARELSMGKRLIVGENEDASHSLSVDIGDALTESLGGNGMKDERSDAAGTISAVFRKIKETWSKDSVDQPRSIDRVFQSITTFGDNTRLLDSLFINVARVSYIDPAFDRSALAHEWLSLSDTFRSQKTSNNLGAMISVQSHHIPTAGAAIHLLCRVEQRPDLVITTREFYDNQFKMDGNQSLVQRFADGITPQSRCSRCVDLMTTETVPYALWILSSGYGTSSLDRATASMELLNKEELVSFARHASLLQSLGLTYVASEHAPHSYHKSSHSHVVANLEPPIERLVEYSSSNLSRRRDIPAALKLLLARRVSTERQSHASEDIKRALPVITSLTDIISEQSLAMKRTAAIASLKLPSPKKTKLSSSPTSVATSKNFLQIGARKAMEAKSARHAARVGYDRSRKNKTSHTGSGVALPSVLRLKFVKGYTEAVRTPCQLGDLA